MAGLENQLVEKMKTSGLILSTVESCTGGLIAHRITNVSGASSIFWGSFVTYDNSAKEDLGIANSVLEKHGAVSAAVARALAEGGMKKIESCLGRASSTSLKISRGLVCVSTTGIAGPTGGTPEKPVGLCFIAVAVSGQETRIEKFQAPDVTDRLRVKEAFAEKALELILSCV